MNIRRSLRIIFRSKTYSLLNILGLAIGITSAALIFLWVESKVNFNKAIPNSRNIYVSACHYFPVSSECITSFESTNLLAKALSDEFPEVTSCGRYKDQTLVFVPENTTDSFEEKGAYADSTLFNMIGMKFISGDVSSVFEPQYSIVLSRSMARKIYNEEDPIGKGLIHEGVIYQVTGVFEDMPGNTSFQFEWLIPFRVFVEDMKKVFDVNEWGASWLQTYVELAPGVELDQLNGKLKELAFCKAGETYKSIQIFLYPLNKMLLYDQFKDGVETGGGYIKTVSLFFLIGVLILLIACINFMNFSTARPQKRALEVGVRKTFGTKRKYLIRQFLVESGLITSIALVLSVGLIWLSLPWFNKFIGVQLSFNLFDPTILTGLVAIGLFCTFLAGSYLALYLSSFNPLTTLKMQKVSKGKVPHGYARDWLSFSLRWHLS
ncbi:MAG: ABC transporter permease [Parabacteroides sp.]|nr:ABC transporter permease [Parabacteroides sp.]